MNKQYLHKGTMQSLKSIARIEKIDYAKLCYNVNGNGYTITAAVYAGNTGKGKGANAQYTKVRATRI